MKNIEEGRSPRRAEQERKGRAAECDGPQLEEDEEEDSNCHKRRWRRQDKQQRGG